jgi:hypothetical protein
MPSKPLEELYKEFPDEWLLIRVTKTDRFNVPLEGEVLFHSPDRDEIAQYDDNHDLEGDILIYYSGDPVPKGWEVLLEWQLSALTPLPTSFAFLRT